MTRLTPLCLFALLLLLPLAHAHDVPVSDAQGFLTTENDPPTFTPPPWARDNKSDKEDKLVQDGTIPNGKLQIVLWGIGILIISMNLSFILARVRPEWWERCECECGAENDDWTNDL